MSISWGTQYPKLKTNLRLAINRLKLVEKKKTELAQKSRKEIADFISGHKEDRARIRVEHIIREDYLVEAYELLEMYCDLLLARFGLIQQMKNLDEGIEEAVNSIMWAAPRIATDIAEFKIISDQLTLKYGKPFAEACRSDQLGKVSPKLKAKLSVQAPPKVLVERYMIEIAKSCNVPFTPDVNIMREDEVLAAEAMLIDFQNQGQQGYGWMYPQAAGVQAPPPPHHPGGPGGPGYYSGPPPPPHGGGSGGGGGGGIGVAMPPPDIQYPPGVQPFNYPNLKQVGVSSDPGPVTKVPMNPHPGQPTAPPPV
uniref:IST1 homolog n=2 Tax=Plectus sambesii TaxID=2011161 RepID=A0A914UW56_9BILA